MTCGDGGSDDDILTDDVDNVDDVDDVIVAVFLVLSWSVMC